MKNTMYSYKVTGTISGGYPMCSYLFVGSKTPRTLLEWMKVFKIITRQNIVELNSYKPDDAYMYIKSYIKKLLETLEELNLKLCIDFQYEQEHFYIGRTIESIQSICKDIELWKEYGITDIDIFAGMYNEKELLCYSVDDCKK